MNLMFITDNEFNVWNCCDSEIDMASRWSKRRKIQHDVECHLDMIRQLESTGSCLSDCSGGNHAAAIEHRETDDVSAVHMAVDYLTDVEDCSSDVSSEHSSDLPECSYKSSSDFSFSENSEDFESESETELHADVEANNESSVQTKLADWAVEHRIPHVAIGSLLNVLRPNFSDLPKDPRTLLNTSTVVETKNVAGGIYCHVGIEKQIVRLLSHTLCNTQGCTLAVQVNIDGIPLCKSSNSQLWPILGRIENVHGLSSGSLCKDPFIIGIYHGTSKPSSVDEFLQDFVHEMLDLEKNGLVLNNVVHKIRISAFVCDMPARSYVKCVKGHGAYGGCDRCTQHGVYLRKVTFPETVAPLRTDELFREMVNRQYHTQVSPLASLPVDMVSGFVLDYMHLVCLGVVRKMVSLWLTGPLKTRIGWRAVREINEKLVSLKPYVPLEFPRKPRPISEFEHWKAVEFRQLLLYTGPMCLTNVLTPELYNNFLLLCVAMSVLLSPSLCDKYIPYSRELLVSFVKHFACLYGSDTLTYNVHALVHISDDASRYGVLDNISAFPFENFLGKLKRSVRKPNFPLQQIVRRMSERRSGAQSEELTYPILKGEHCSGPVASGIIVKKQYREAVFQNFTVKLTTGDRFVELTSGNVVNIENIVVDKDGRVILMYRKYYSFESFFDYPCSSTNIGIYKFSHLGNALHYVEISEIRKKCVVVPYKKSWFVGIPLAHTN